MLTYKELPASAKEQLKKFPVYESLLAATYHEHGIDAKEKQSAIRFIHVKTYRPDQELADFYADAEKDFEKNLVLMNDQLPMDKKKREVRIREEIAGLEKILDRLDESFAMAMRKSMESFREHVANAHQSLVEYFVFPIPIKGLTY